MGRLDQSFAEAANTVVFSRRGFPRYSKRFNRKGVRKAGRFHSIGNPYWGLTRTESTRIRVGKHRVD